MVIINEKQALPQAPVPLQPPPPYAYAPPPPIDTQVYPMPASPLSAAQQQLFQHQQLQAQQVQQIQLQQQLAALHIRQRTGPRAVTPSASSPAQSTFIPAYTARAPPPNLSTIPAHLVLRIIYAAFPAGTDHQFEHTRQVLLWLATSGRATCRALYVACMHVLRSSYLPAYTENVRPPYSSDPYPANGEAQRETEVLDLYLLVKVRDDVRGDESELHLDLDSFRDVFDMMQPRARTEDLVRQYGMSSGVVAGGSNPRNKALPFAAVSVNFSPRSVSLNVNVRGGRKKTLVEVTRAREERLEESARRVVAGLEKIIA